MPLHSLYLTRSDAVATLPSPRSLARVVANDDDATCLDHPPFDRATNRDAALARAASLPHDLFRRVASELPPADLPSVTATCAAWRDGFGAAVGGLAPGGLVDGAALARRFPRLARLDLSRVPPAHATDAALAPLAALTGLTHLSLAGCRRATAAGVRALTVSVGARLTFLNVSACASLGPTGGLATALPPGSLHVLTTLAAARLDWAGDGDAAAVAAAAPALVMLSLDGARHLGAAGVAALASLRLTLLSLAGCDALTDDAVAALASCTRLTALTLDRCGRVTGAGVAALASVPLTRLTLRDSGATDAGVTALAQGAPHLTRLVLDDTGVSDEGVAALARCPALSSLSLRGTRVGGGALVTLLPSLTRLLTLDLGACPHLDGGALGAAVAASPCLRDLDVSACERVDDEALTTLTTCASLTRLSVSRCPRITDGGLARLVDSAAARSLADMAAAACPGVTDAGAASLATLPHLTRVDLSNNTRVTDVGAAALAAAPHLARANMACTSVSGAGVRALAAGRADAGRPPATVNAWGCPAALAEVTGGRPPLAGLSFDHLKDANTAVAA